MSQAAESEARRALVKGWRRARLAGLLDNVPRVGPQTVHFDIANACNTRCTTCWHHSPHLLAEHVPSAAWKRESLPLTRFREVLDDLLRLGGLEAIILSGMGDPSLNDDLYAMVERAHAEGIGVTIITNLLRLDLARLFGASRYPEVPLDLLTSICGVTGPVWQAFHAHPKPRGFDALTAQLERLAARGFRPKHVQVINAQNFDEVPAMVDFAARFPAKVVNFKLASLARGTEAVAMTPAQRAQLASELVPEAQRRAEVLGVQTDLAAFARQIHVSSHRTAPIDEVGCFMGFSYARVTVLGEVLFCCNTQVGVGQLGPGRRLSDLWAGPAWQARRDAVRRGEYFAGCDQCGKFKQNLKWSDKLREALPAAEFARLLGRDEAPARPAAADIGEGL